ncbi:hypothetical protein DQ04_13481010 [Trypanosoma grayi]|uniref:hypothetical protein n=1 Tax=Trypanosoma grayi TaxID=71804 RepID=UPI0004F40AEC|nr:hypothetical protein DQ04_13481010 [Trypanosoma grayi]KEG06527.1 hypothetical protein DQ04_13481010 [Trypanosoma grayi]
MISAGVAVRCRARGVVLWRGVLCPTLLLLFATSSNGDCAGAAWRFEADIATYVVRMRRAKAGGITTCQPQRFGEPRNHIEAYTRAAYFRQVRCGLFFRMALLSGALSWREGLYGAKWELTTATVPLVLKRGL